MVVALHGKVRRQRVDHAHKTALTLVRECDVIAHSAGRRLIPVDPRNTSRTCPRCGHVCGDNRLTQAEFVCVACGYAANADVVGAFNVANRAGLVLREAAA